MEQISGFRIAKLVIQETGTYNDQWRRPYNTHLQGSTMSQMTERLRGVTEYQAPLFAGIANQFIAPQATPEKQIDIANGWNERRFRFMMEVEIDLYMGGRVKEVILGWTDHMGISLQGSIDPRMQFYVNSTLQIRETIARTPIGQQTYTSVIDNSHILVDPTWSGVYTPEVDHRLRPEDVFSTMSRTHLDGLGKVYDGRSAATKTAVKSKRGNGSAANYMADILRSYTQASVLGEQTHMGEQEVLMKARGFSQENLASADHFLAAIAQLRGMGVENVFEFRDLQSLDPSVENVTVVSVLGPTQKVSVHQAGQTANWGAADRETVAATVISHSVPAMMMDVAITSAWFKSTNNTINSQPETIFMDVQGFSTGDMSQQVNFFKNQLESTILYDLTYGGQIAYAIEVKADLLGETWIKISLGGDPFIDYVTPSFADALIVPVLTNNADSAVQLASDFEMLATGLQEAATENHPSLMSAGGSAFGNI
jgi:hypothetical protein